MNLPDMFEPTYPLYEVIARGTIIYLFLFCVLRILRREAGAIGISDLLLIVLIADAVQNGMSNDYKSITEAIVLVLTIVFWDYLIDWLSYRYRFFERIARPAALPLIKNGKVIRKNLRQEMITMEEIWSHLRQQGIEELSEVKMCYLEGDGNVSIIKENPSTGDVIPPKNKLAQ